MASFQGIEFERSNPPATDEQLAKLEELIGGTLPEDYRNFLSTLNGGVIQGEYEFPLRGENPGIEFIALNVLYSALPGDYDYIPTHLDDYFFRRRVPDRLVPIGINLFEHRISISLREQDYGHIYVWAPEDKWIEEDECEQAEDELYYASDSFLHVWNSLRAASS